MDGAPGRAIDDLQRLVVEFSRRRGWNNDSKNLAMSVAIEAAELMEVFQWTSTGAGLAAERREDLALECADVLWYLMRLCANEGIDLAGAVRAKAAINEVRFPAAPEARVSG